MNTTDNRDYYDAFSQQYDVGRDRGYHQLIDEQAAALVKRYGTGKDVVEVGCGTGLILARVAEFAARSRGIDVSPGMLERARSRGLEVMEASASKLPFDDESLDLAYSFKVLAHVPEFDASLKEMLRVVRPGGHVIFDVYNRHSLRYLIKRVFGPRTTSTSYDESAITTRFLSPREAETRIPPEARVVASAGIRIVTPHPAFLRIPGLARVTRTLEWNLMHTSLSRFAGFLVYVLEKQA